MFSLGLIYKFGLNQPKLDLVGHLCSLRWLQSHYEKWGDLHLTLQLNI